MRRINWQVFLIILTFFSITCETAARQITVGWLEEVNLGQQGFMILAKLDTGADNSSINAVDVSSYSKDGQQWVRFTIENRHGREAVIEKPVKKTVRIKTKEGGSQERMVIELNICLSGIKKKVYVNLVNRGHYKYQMLIGRSFLSPEFLVDSSQKYTSDVSCP